MVNNQMKGKSSYLKNVILLDTGSTLKATFINPNLVTDIITSRNPVGINTNAGTNRIILKETVKGIGHAWYDSTQVVNIFSFSHLK